MEDVRQESSSIDVNNLSNCSRSYQVTARRYRPQTFRDVLGQDAVVSTIKNGIRLGRLASAYLFAGSRGTGKTTLTRVFAKSLLCQHVDENCEPCGQCTSCQQIANGSFIDVLEIDGASHRGIDDIRMITESVGYTPAQGQYKIYIIDEVHMLTKEAFNALLKTLEEPPDRVKFFFATTEPQKIPETILSRCQRFHLRRISIELIAKKLKKIAEDAAIPTHDDALYLLAQYAEGGLRDAECMLDILIAYGEEISTSTLETVLGTISRKYLFDFDTAFAKQEYQYVFTLTNLLFNEGKDIQFFVKDFIQHFRHILLCKLACFEAHCEDLSYVEAIKKASASYTHEECLAILDILMTSEAGLKSAISQRVFLETILLKIMRMHSLIALDQIAAKLVQLEKKITNQQPQKQVTPEVQKPAKIQTEEVLSPKQEILRTLPEPHVQKPAPPTPPTTAPTTKESASQTHQSHFDTVMQFAAVELQGVLEKNKKG